MHVKRNGPDCRVETGDEKERHQHENRSSNAG